MVVLLLAYYDYTRYACRVNPKTNANLPAVLRKALTREVIRAYRPQKNLVAESLCKLQP